MQMTRLLILATCLGATGPAHAQDSFDCIMDPARVVEIGTPVPGILEDVTVSRGDSVTKGQVLARLESRVQEATVNILRTRAENTEQVGALTAQRDLIGARRNRIATLVERGVSTPDRLDAAETEMVTAVSALAEARLAREVARQELERARAQIEERTITSPITGIVMTADRASGERIDTQGRILSLVQLDPLHVEAFLPVELYPGIAIGQPAEIRPAPPFDSSYTARVTVIDRVFDAASSTFGVRLELSNPDGRLPAGHRCTLSIKTR